MGEKYEILGHTVELRVSNSGSHDPWTGDYAKEKGVGLIGTADIKTFILIDGDTVYSLKQQLPLIKALEETDFSSWEDVKKTINNFVSKYDKPISLKESFKDIDRLKVENDKLSKMSKKEKREYWEELKKNWKEKNNK